MKRGVGKEGRGREGGGGRGEGGTLWYAIGTPLIPVLYIILAISTAKKRNKCVMKYTN